MAKQRSVIKLDGTLDDITFSKTEFGYLARMKTSLNGEKIKTDPAFQRTRENMSEFGNAAHSSKVLRSSIQSLLTLAKDSLLQSRLVKALMAVVHSDTTDDRGQRVVANGDITLMEGFNFNRHAEFASVFQAPYSTTVDRTTGTLTVDIPAFQPALSINAPEGTTHFRIVMAGSEVDFANSTFVSDIQQTAILPWDDNNTTLISQNLSVTAGTVLPLFINIGVLFYEQVNGNYYPLKNNAYNPLGVVKVDQV